MTECDPLASIDDCVVVTGASGFIGSRVVANLLSRGFKHVRCCGRQATSSQALATVRRSAPQDAFVELMDGNLLSPETCRAATKGARVVYHLAAARGAKSFPDAYLNSVVTTRNLLEACRRVDTLRRVVNVSSLSVYSNVRSAWSRVLDESNVVEPEPHRRDAYTYAKVKQDQMVAEYGEKHGVPYVIVRPGVVYGPGNIAIHGRVGLGTFGVFLHLGGGNPVPFTFVDNCAEAIVLAGLTPGIDGEAFNIVDGHSVSSRRFLRLYKRNVRRFHSVYVPHAASYLLCLAWEWYARWSHEQLPPLFSRRMWRVYWKKTQFSNVKARTILKWSARVPEESALGQHFEACRSGEKKNAEDRNRGMRQDSGLARACDSATIRL